jgi:hypothetical protein
MNTGLLLEVLLVSFVLFSMVNLFFLQYFSLERLLLNEKESRKILELVEVSDRYVARELSVVRLGNYVENVVDCSRLSCEGNLYLSCGPYSCGNPEGKRIIRRYVVFNGRATVLEVGIP